MNKAWLVFKYEYTRHVLRKRFLITLLSMPLFMGFIMGISVVASLLSINRNPIGYVDQAGILAGYTPSEPKEGLFEFDLIYTPYATEESARVDMEKKSIQAYFVVPTDFLQTNLIKLAYLVAPGNNIEGQIESLIHHQILSSQPAEILQRIEDGNHMTVISADGTRQVGEHDWINLVILFGSGILFIIVVFTSSGYLMQALVEEKENRTMEIVVTSVSPEQLMTGKVLGNLSVGLTQLLAWAVIIVAAILIGRNSVDWMQNIHINTSTIVVFALTMFPAFVMVAALMALLGSTVSETREASQWTSLITLPVVAPYWLASMIIVNPNSPLAVGLSLFPLTAPVTISMRMAVAVIPMWQIAASSALLFVCAGGAIWLAARAFRLGMVRYGKKIMIKELLMKAG